MAEAATSFLHRHEFLVRRLHSLTGLVPVGVFVIMHLTVNASVLNGPETFQNSVYSIHALGKLLPLVEWAFIFTPLLFHAILGVVIASGGLPNTNRYKYGPNYRYRLQRITGIIAFFFILYHVFHMHGWFHFDWWLKYVAEPLGGATFRPYNAPSTAGASLQNLIVSGIYAFGIIATVFHLSNGIWSMGITWGVWTTPAAQKRALAACGLFGIVLGTIGLSGLWGMREVGAVERIDEVQQIENRMYEARVEGGSVIPNEHKRVGGHDEDNSRASDAKEESAIEAAGIEEPADDRQGPSLTVPASDDNTTE